MANKHTTPHSSYEPELGRDRDPLVQLTQENLTESIAEDAAVSKMHSQLRYDETVVRNQNLMIDRIAELHSAMADHNAKAATSAEIKQHAAELEKQLKQQTKQFETTIRSLHSELSRHSLRHRASIYASFFVGFATLLFTVSLFLGELRIQPRVLMVFLFGTILFWFLTRAIPPVSSLQEEENL